jgi:hypothetical protein
MTSEADVADFGRDGAVVVRGLFSPVEMALLARGIDLNIAEPSPLAIVASRPEDPGFFIEDFCNWQHSGISRIHILQSGSAGCPAIDAIENGPALS